MLLIGTDVGTSGTKTVITDEAGNILAHDTQSYGFLTPRQAWAEQDADIWFEAAVKSIKNAVSKAGHPSKDYAAICISGLYGGSGVPVDKDFKSIRPCIFWMDRRAVDICEDLERNIDTKRLFAVTENAVDSYFGFPKILWIKKHEPELFSKIHMFLTPSQYIIYKLCGEAVIDNTAAGNLGGLYDMEKEVFSKEMSDMLGIPLSLMPERILKPYEEAGKLKKEWADKMGLPEGLPMAAGCVDCLASTLAAGVVSPGQTSTVLATSLNWGIIHTDKPQRPEYITMPYVTDIKGIRYTYGGMSTAGALTKWFSESFAPGIFMKAGKERLSFEDLEREASNIPVGSEGLILLPYFMGERCPVWDSDARGLLLGLSLSHNAAHIYRAILEGVAFGMRNIMDVYGDGIDRAKACKLVGGATSSELWCSILASVTGTPMEVMEANVEAPYGDAFLAGRLAGIFKDFSEIGKWNIKGKIYREDIKAAGVYDSYYNVYKGLYDKLKSDMHNLSGLTKDEQY